MAGADWVAADWGTSNLRVWVFDDAGHIIDQGQSEQGMGQLTPEQFEDVLIGLIERHLSVSRVLPVVISGMAGARQGWVEAPYAPVPAPPPSAKSAARPVLRDPRIAVSILPGMSQAKPADVMRGEETQIAGFLSANPKFDGVICLPGTHSKWVHISAGEVVSFRTFMTGEIFALLASQSVLRHSVSTEGWDNAAFTLAVEHAMSTPASVAADLFRLRADGLLHDLAAAEARARLSGLLLGMELAGARAYWLGQNVALIGERALSDLYAEALAAQGVPVEQADVTEMTIAGLTAARRAMKGS